MHTTHFWGQCFDRNDLCEEGEQPLFLSCANQAAQLLPCALSAAATIASIDSFHPKYWMKWICALQGAIQNASKCEVGWFKYLQGNENQEPWNKLLFSGNLVTIFLSYNLLRFSLLCLITNVFWLHSCSRDNYWFDCEHFFCPQIGQKIV